MYFLYIEDYSLKFLATFFFSTLYSPIMFISFALVCIAVYGRFLILYYQLHGKNQNKI